MCDATVETWSQTGPRQAKGHQRSLSGTKGGHEMISNALIPTMRRFAHADCGTVTITVDVGTRRLPAPVPRQGEIAPAGRAGGRHHGDGNPEVFTVGPET